MINSLIDLLYELRPKDNYRGGAKSGYMLGVRDAIAIVRRHYEGRPAVAGKPLEIQTRDELLAYIRQQQPEDQEDIVIRLLNDQKFINRAVAYSHGACDLREVSIAAIAAMGSVSCQELKVSGVTPRNDPANTSGYSVKEDSDNE